MIAAAWYRSDTLFYGSLFFVLGALAGWALGGADLAMRFFG